MSIFQQDADIKNGKKGIYGNPVMQEYSFTPKCTITDCSPPLEWKIRCAVRSGPDQKEKRRLGELTGGYLYSDPKLGNGHSTEAPALSSQDESRFDIRQHGEALTRQLTRVLNKLQSVPFQINGLFQRKLHEDWDDFQKYGLVMPKILNSKKSTRLSGPWMRIRSFVFTSICPRSQPELWEKDKSKQGIVGFGLIVWNLDE